MNAPLPSSARAVVQGVQKMTPSEVFVETLVAQGVDTMFGIMGSAFMDAMDIFAPAGIRLVPADPFDLIGCSRCVAIADAGRWQLPAGLSEDELLRGYVPFPEEPR